MTNRKLNPAVAATAGSSYQCPHPSIPKEAIHKTQQIQPGGLSFHGDQLSKPPLKALKFPGILLIPDLETYCPNLVIIRH